MSKKTFSIISLGCFRNIYDSGIVTERFIEQGYIFKKEPEGNDTLIINTCGFIAAAKEEATAVIKDAVQLKKQGKVKKLIVMGCLVQRYRKELEKFFPQVDAWQGIEDFKQNKTKAVNLTYSHIGFLKICEGCLHNCSYCAIPLIKGKLRSRNKEEIIYEAKDLEKQGVKELNIIGQDITSWGKDLGLKEDLTGLIKAILKETKIPWIRLIYTHPKYVTKKLVDLIAKEKRICKYIDLPIQHINNRILKLMNRGVDKDYIIKLIEYIRKKIPNVVIRTSLIVGFPSETKQEFNELLKFVKQVRFDRLGVFTYSREEGTLAYKLSGQVSHSIKQHREEQIMLLQREIAEQKNKQFIDKKIEVLVDEKCESGYLARTQYDAYEVDNLVFVNRKNLTTGKFYEIKISDTVGYDLIGE